MYRSALIVVVVVVLAGCQRTQDPSLTLREDFKPFFDAHQVEGSILIYDLPFSQRTIDIVKDILVREETGVSVLRAKTGWAGETGWLVGYLEQNDKVYFFATTIAIINAEDNRAREAVTRAIFEHMGLF